MTDRERIALYLATEDYPHRPDAELLVLSKTTPYPERANDVLGITNIEQLRAEAEYLSNRVREADEILRTITSKLTVIGDEELERRWAHIYSDYSVPIKAILKAQLQRTIKQIEGL